MAGAVQTFKDGAVEKVRLAEEAARIRDVAEAERGRNAAATAEAARELAVVVDALGSAMTRLSGGDLTCRVDQAFSADYQRLRMDFNATVEKLQQTMIVIAASSHEINAGAENVSQTADSLARRTEQQAAGLEQTAAALDQITATVQRSATGAAKARTVVAEARSDAEHSGKVVRDAVTAMGEIEASSRQISQIIGVIDEIAFQTNLLALNAGVEAARAGDAGRGFAVVASEVRGLAQRAAVAAKEIKQLISASTRQVGAGVSLVSQTGEALRAIIAQVAQIDEVVGQIAASAQEEAVALNQISAAMNQICRNTAGLRRICCTRNRMSIAEIRISAIARACSKARGRARQQAKPRRPAPASIRAGVRSAVRNGPLIAPISRSQAAAASWCIWP